MKELRMKEWQFEDLKMVQFDQLAKAEDDRKLLYINNIFFY